MSDSGNVDRVGRKWPMILAGAIFVWGTVIAVGAYLTYRDFGKPLVIFASTVIFSLIWVAVARANVRAAKRALKSAGTDAD